MYGMKLDKPYKLCKVDNCAIKFKVKSNELATFILVSKDCPHKDCYKVALGQSSSLVSTFATGQQPIIVGTPHIDLLEYTEFLVTWFSSIIRIGLVGDAPFLEYVENNAKVPAIGFIKFITQCSHVISDWIFESSPVSSELPRIIQIKGGKLKWMPMTGKGLLPPDAMIGGFENEPIYIARSHHNQSLCPGKYVPSKRHSFIAWGHEEHRKKHFEILCGFDAQWMKCEGNNIPENAFIGGFSEVNKQPLYIGRAMIEGNLICGKVHLLYKLCYIPYEGREVEKYYYEILVTPGIVARAVQTPKKCNSYCH
ncbi:unnamed protein product [Parnassius apollo]|uniref:(apollo) hypothetical protein n=1 Tax=Parnassius apollo TaxID=110799 RepID=A0A8S3WUN6_PARAO|nr:unnamed protein product [Parnassius apollo]